MSAKRSEIVTESGTERFIPLNKLKKSPNNARKTPHSEAAIESYAASIAAKGILQNLVVEPELDGGGAATGFYFVTIGEGRRLAQLLRVRRKEIKKTEPIRCVIDTANDAFEISLDENITREDMHPADQFEAFKKLADKRGFGAEEIAARFGVTPHVVRQRLRLSAVSPRLIDAYRGDEMGFEQLVAFALIDDHARQEAIYDRLSYSRDPVTVRRMLTETNVAATDRRAVFVGHEAYAEAGGTILRDLFTEDRGGYFEDAALLDRLALEKLQRVAAALQKDEGWKWAEANLDFPHGHGLRRVYPREVELSAEDHTIYEAAQAEFNLLTKQHESLEELPEDVDARFGELEAEIERLEALRHAYDADDVACGGAFVVLNHDGDVRIERGFIRPDDDNRQRNAFAKSAMQGGDEDAADCDDDTESDAGLSDNLIADLTAHRTLGLRLALSEQPDVALVAVIHALVSQTFYQGAEANVLDIRPGSLFLGSHADGIADTEAGRSWSDRHARWAAQLPRDVADLWAFVVALGHDSRMAVFAHCAALTVNAVKLPRDHRPRALATADSLAETVGLDMTGYWRPTVRTYLGRITKARILEAVREAVSSEAADRMAGMKKPDMAEAAELLLAPTGWLPALMRAPQAVERDVTQSAAEAATDGPANAYANAAE
ncbi:ParB/RepB/Spo0J family partition protein [Bradyrhizobium sp. ISRA442]|uniref:ParB/RepB/Spo0J family partition protein n=1 Tax=Bradyrhizobium sp. ISRA442 TaxID=2866197 RepID=UPI00311B075D